MQLPSGGAQSRVDNEMPAFASIAGRAPTRRLTVLAAGLIALASGCSTPSPMPELTKEGFSAPTSFAGAFGYYHSFDAAALIDRNGRRLLKDLVMVEGYFEGNMNKEEDWIDGLHSEFVFDKRFEHQSMDPLDDAKTRAWQDLQAAFMDGMERGRFRSSSWLWVGASVSDCFALCRLSFQLNDELMGSRARVELGVVREHRFPADLPTKPFVAVVLLCNDADNKAFVFPNDAGLKLLRAYLQLCP